MNEIEFCSTESSAHAHIVEIEFEIEFWGVSVTPLQTFVVTTSATTAHPLSISFRLNSAPGSIQKQVSTINRIFFAKQITRLSNQR